MPEFADTLRQRLLAEFPETNGHRARRPRLPLTPRPRRTRLLTAALVLALLASALAAVLLSRPAPASALELIRQAQRDAASLPPFEAKVRFEINPDGSVAGAPKGATQTWRIDYAKPRRIRTSLIGEHLAVAGARAVGSYDVLNGNLGGSYDPQRRFFLTFSRSPYLRPLEDLTWQGGYPDWEKLCRGPAAKVLPDARVAGRDARHVRCTAPGAQVWELWIDRQTGLLLKLKGQTGGGGDFFLDSVPLTSQRGGFTITSLRYHPTFASDTFKVAAPPGALDYNARLQAAEAKLPPFRALVTSRLNGRTRIEQQLQWRDPGTWRVHYLAGGGLDGGPGSVEVSAHGSVGLYNARDNSYSIMAAPTEPSANPNPLSVLLPASDSRYPSDCPISGRDRIEGRSAIRRRCPYAQIWVDARTGLILQAKAPGYEVRLHNLQYDPAFPAGTFHFRRPAGSRSAQKLADDPYFKTRLKPGISAPNWRAHLLSGGSFKVTDLRGRPALLVFLMDNCVNAQTACNVFTPLERVYRQSKGKLAIIWVDIQGNRTLARKIVRHNHLTFPVVSDIAGSSVQAWKLQYYPWWVLLDSHGRVIEARLKPQTLSQLRQLVNDAR